MKRCGYFPQQCHHLLNLRYTMNQYLIYDEENELMRTVSRREEAKHLTQNRQGWSYKCVRQPVRKLDLSQFEEALI
jgi:hypothetical protein